MKKANVLVAAGAVLLVIGLAVVWIISQDTDDGPDERTVPVLVARADLSAGESSDDAIAAGKVSVEQVVESKAKVGALADTTAMAGTILATAVEEGEQVVEANIRPEGLRTASIDIPEGMQAMAVTVGYTEGAAGYANIGDRVNVYVTIDDSREAAPVKPLTKLLLTNVEVLDVSTEVAPQRATEVTTPGAAATRSGGNTITLLLALDAQDAESAIFASSFDQLWFTVVPKDQEDSKTEGTDYESNYVEKGP